MKASEQIPFAAEPMTVPKNTGQTDEGKRRARCLARTGWDRMAGFGPAVYFVAFAAGMTVVSVIVCLASSLIVFGRVQAQFLLGWLMAAVVTSVVASLAATRIHARSWERQRNLEHFATVDELTGAPNRRVFVDRLESEVDRCSRLQTALCVVFIDIDFFKRINDEYGHQVGDRVLKEIYARLEDNLRLYDFIGRLGGDEFVMALPGTDALTAFGVAERIRESVQRAPEANLPAVTVSLGVAELGMGMGASQLVKNADMALYRAKNSGRNRTEVFQAAGPSGHSIS